MLTITELDVPEAIMRAATTRSWGAKWLLGSMFSVRFDPHDSAEPKPLVQSTALLVGSADWRIETDEQVILACGDPHEYIADAIKILDGRTLTAITPISRGGDITFVFDDLRLHLFPGYSGNVVESLTGEEEPDTQEHWNFCLPCGDVFIGVSGTSVLVGQSSTLKWAFSRRWKMQGRNLHLLSDDG
ncbi:hypothetical protein [Nocardia sp. NPDC058666]|uniref:hypothetical protein n=1 Tax=Nocardia sp. NPDC058666 TaxID=3346587 RepID=UPI0036623E60